MDWCQFFLLLLQQLPLPLLLHQQLLPLLLLLLLLLLPLLWYHCCHFLDIDWYFRFHYKLHYLVNYRSLRFLPPLLLLLQPGFHFQYHYYQYCYFVKWNYLFLRLLYWFYFGYLWLYRFFHWFFVELDLHTVIVVIIWGSAFSRVFIFVFGGVDVWSIFNYVRVGVFLPLHCWNKRPPKDFKLINGPKKILLSRWY